MLDWDIEIEREVCVLSKVPVTTSGGARQGELRRGMESGAGSLQVCVVEGRNLVPRHPGAPLHAFVLLQIHDQQVPSHWVALGWILLCGFFNPNRLPWVSFVRFARWHPTTISIQTGWRSSSSGCAPRIPPWWSVTPRPHHFYTLALSCLLDEEFLGSVCWAREKTERSRVWEKEWDCSSEVCSYAVNVIICRLLLRRRYRVRFDCHCCICKHRHYSSEGSLPCVLLGISLWSQVPHWRKVEGQGHRLSSRSCGRRNPCPVGEHPRRWRRLRWRNLSSTPLHPFITHGYISLYPSNPRNTTTSSSSSFSGTVFKWNSCEMEHLTGRRGIIAQFQTFVQGMPWKQSTCSTVLSLWRVKRE